MKRKSRATLKYIATAWNLYWIANTIAEMCLCVDVETEKENETKHKEKNLTRILFHLSDW